MRKKSRSLSVIVMNIEHGGSMYHQSRECWSSFIHMVDIVILY